MQPNPCDIADPFIASMRKQFGVLKLTEVPEPGTRGDTVIMTLDVLKEIPLEFLQYRIGRLLIVVGGLVPDELIQTKLVHYMQYGKKKLGYTVYSRNRPPLTLG